MRRREAVPEAVGQIQKGKTGYGGRMTGGRKIPAPIQGEGAGYHWRKSFSNPGTGWERVLSPGAI